MQWVKQRTRGRMTDSWLVAMLGHLDPKKFPRRAEKLWGEEVIEPEMTKGEWLGLVESLATAEGVVVKSKKLKKQLGLDGKKRSKEKASG